MARLITRFARSTATTRAHIGSWHMNGIKVGTDFEGEAPQLDGWQDREIPYFARRARSILRPSGHTVEASTPYSKGRKQSMKRLSRTTHNLGIARSVRGFLVLLATLVLSYPWPTPVAAHSTLSASLETTSLAAVGVNQNVSLRSFNAAEHYIRHRYNLGELSPISSALDQADATFKIVPGLADPAAVSLNPTNFPGQYLRHQNFQLRLDRSDNTAVFKQDATFWQRPGLADAYWTSFEVV